MIDSFGKKPHDLLIQKAIPAATDEWSLVQSFQRIQPVTGRERRFWLYRRSAPFSRPARDLEVDLTYTLGRVVKAPTLPAPISTLSFD